MSASTKFIRANELGFKDTMLDALLAAGYYRMQHYMFTCNETPTSEDEGFIIPVFWLRTLVQKCSLGRGAQAVLKRNAVFEVAVLPAALDEEIESLYHLYRQHKPFSTSISCADYLHTPELPQPFDSWMVQVRHGKKLIAVGFFDKGNATIAGIMNIYHPDYEKNSLGKFLILQKLLLAKQQQIKYYYTGYISTASTRFDYKTFPDEKAVQVYLAAQNSWADYHLLGKPFLEQYYLQELI